MEIQLAITSQKIQQKRVQNLIDRKILEKYKKNKIGKKIVPQSAGPEVVGSKRNQCFVYVAKTQMSTSSFTLIQF